MKNKLLSIFVVMAIGLSSVSSLVFGADTNVNYVESQKFNITTSSTIKDYTDTTKQAKHMVDGNAESFWCSAWINERVPKCEEYILFDFKEIKKINSVTLSARSDGLYFPSEFKFQWSTSNEVNIDIEGKSYKDYETQENLINTFTFEKGIVARYLKMFITARSADSTGVHLVCISEVDANFTAATDDEKAAAVKADAAVERPLVVNDPEIGFNVETSSYLEQEDFWLPEHLNDGELSTQWCSEWVGTTVAEDKIWVKMTLEDAFKVTGIILHTQGNCFPKDFKFQYSFDGVNYVDIDGASSYTNYEISESSQYVFPFTVPQCATSIRLYVTKKSADPSGNYLVQLADVEVRGFAATAEERSAAETVFNSKIGNLPPEISEKPALQPVGPEDVVKGCGANIMCGQLFMGLIALFGAAIVIKRK